MNKETNNGVDYQALLNKIFAASLQKKQKRLSYHEIISMVKAGPTRTKIQSRSKKYKREDKFINENILWKSYTKGTKVGSFKKPVQGTLRRLYL